MENRVPVTAKLSRKFYERLGDDVASELVDWFNAVDLTYQTQLREQNDRNWERFKSHLDASLAAFSAELRGEFRAGLAELRGELQLGQNELRGEFRLAQSDSRGQSRSSFAELRLEIKSGQQRLLKWMLISFFSAFVGLAGLVLSLATFLRG